MVKEKKISLEVSLEASAARTYGCPRHPRICKIDSSPLLRMRDPG